MPQDPIHMSMSQFIIQSTAIPQLIQFLKLLVLSHAEIRPQTLKVSTPVTPNPIEQEKANSSGI